MNKYIVDFHCTYFIYGGTGSGKTTLVNELIDILDEQGKADNILAMTSSEEDYTFCDVQLEYDINFINEWLKGKKIIDEEGNEKYEQEDKILILDDFLHLQTENGKVGKHIKSIISTARHDDKKVNVIVSTQDLSCGKLLRKLPKSYFFFEIDEDVIDMMKKHKKRVPFEQIDEAIRANEYTFLAITSKGEWELIKLNV